MTPWSIGGAIQAPHREAAQAFDILGGNGPVAYALSAVNIAL